MNELTQIDERDSGLHALREKHDWAASLPDDIQWFRGLIDASEIGALEHIFAPLWSVMSGGVGTVRSSAQALLGGASRASTEFAQDVNLIETIATRFVLEELGMILLGANSLEQGSMMLLDGNHRAVALEMMALRGVAGVPIQLEVCVVLSLSTQLHRWDDA